MCLPIGDPKFSGECPVKSSCPIPWQKQGWQAREESDHAGSMGQISLLNGKTSWTLSHSSWKVSFHACCLHLPLAFHTHGSCLGLGLLSSALKPSCTCNSIALTQKLLAVGTPARLLPGPVSTRSGHDQPPRTDDSDLPCGELLLRTALNRELAGKQSMVAGGGWR